MSSEKLIQTIFNMLFGDHNDADGLWKALLADGQNQSPRVQLAILKLSEGDPEKLLQYIEAARVDYRDVLAWAEYPEQLSSGKNSFNTPPDEYEDMLGRDRRQYEAWLDKYRLESDE
jgi:hypothetical protein